MLGPFIVVLKFASILLGGIFGIIGLLIDFKDSEGKITDGGRRALVIIVISTLVAISSQALEMIQQSESTLEAIKTNNKILAEIDRGVHPIKDLRYSFLIKEPFDHQYMQPYRARLDETIQRISSKTLPSIGVEDDKLHVELMAKNPNGTDILLINPKSQFLPNENSEPIAYDFLKEVEVRADFYREPLTSAYITDSTKQPKPPDLRLSIMTSFQEGGYSGKHSLFYDRGNGEIGIKAERIKADFESFGTRSNGALAGISDLLGSQMYLTIIPSQYLYDEERRIVAEIGKGSELQVFNLIIADGREIWLNANRFKRHIDVQGYPYYVYTFPNTLEELNKLGSPILNFPSLNK